MNNFDDDKTINDKRLLELWTDKNWIGSFTGVKTFQLLLATDKDIHVSEKKILDILKKEPVYLLHLKPNKKLNRRSYNLSYYGELVQIDVAYMFEYEEHKYFLIAIDCFSLKCFSEPLKSKTSQEVLNTFKKLIKCFACNITKVQSDQGSEFTQCKAYCEANKILYQFKFGTNKANFAEWIIMIIKRRLYKILRYNLDKNWPKQLPFVIEQYNRTPQKKIGFLSPEEIKSPFDSAKVFEARKKHNLKPFTLTTYKDQRQNQQIYEQKKQLLQVNDYVYLDFKQSLFGKSFDTPVRKKIYEPLLI